MPCSNKESNGGGLGKMVVEIYVWALVILVALPFIVLGVMK